MKKKLKEIVTQIRGVSYKPTDIKSEIDGIPILRANNIQDDGINLDELVYIDSKKVHEEQYLKKGDIVICASSGSKNLVGKAATYNKNEKASFGAFCKVVRVNESENLCKEFVQQYFQSKLYRNAISELSIGANINNIKTEHIDALEINVPSLPEQQKIAAHLDSIQSAIDNKKQQLQQLDELVKSKFYELFEKDFLDKSRTCKMSDICTAMIGLTYKPTNVTETGTIVLRSGNIQEKELYLEDDIVRVSDVKIKDAIYIQDKDVLMCSRNGSARLVGKSCLIRNPKEKMTFGAFMTVIRGEYPYFIQGFLSSDFFKDQLTGVKTASVNQITTSMLYSYDTIKPDSKKETEFAKFVEKSDSAKSIIKTQLADLQELLDSKMDEYFGE